MLSSEIVLHSITVSRSNQNEFLAFHYEFGKLSLKSLQSQPHSAISSTALWDAVYKTANQKTYSYCKRIVKESLYLSKPLIPAFQCTTDLIEENLALRCLLLLNGECLTTYSSLSLELLTRPVPLLQNCFWSVVQSFYLHCPWCIINLKQWKLCLRYMHINVQLLSRLSLQNFVRIIWSSMKMNKLFSSNIRLLLFCTIRSQVLKMYIFNFSLCLNIVSKYYVAIEYGRKPNIEILKLCFQSSYFSTNCYYRIWKSHQFDIYAKKKRS